ncbi:MAG TPA: hypothetical protein VL463_21695, partial [Kofleriaceae bacterium]|nr:hypothetical protein [Kofleriaceae bacterium]
REGEYGGVTPGEKPAQPDTAKPKHKRPPPKDELTWIGFQAKDGGGGELFFQAPAQFTVTQHVEKGMVVVTLSGLRRQVKNARRPLDTRYFDTSIARVTARPRGSKGIEVRIAFKSPKDAHEAQVRTATEPDGMFYAYLDFGAGGRVDVKPSEPSEPDTDAQ